MLTKKTILIVDDSRTDRALYRHYIEHDSENKYQFLEAESIEDGLLMWRSRQPDVLLIDLRLVDGSGMQILKTMQQEIYDEQQEKILQNNIFKNVIRKNDDYVGVIPKLPVIVITGSDHVRDAVDAMQAGAFDYLIKSEVTQSSLLQSIRNLYAYLVLNEQLEQSQKRELIVSRIALKVRQNLILNDICQAIAIEVRQFLQANRTVIYKFNADQTRKIIAESVIEPWISCMNFTSDCPCVMPEQAQMEKYIEGQICASSDIYNSNFSDCHVQMLSAFQVKANLVAPIVLTDYVGKGYQTLWGLLIVHQCDAPRHWHDYEMQFLHQVSTQLAIAIQQSLIYQDLQIANESLERQVQERTRALAYSENKLRSIVDNLPDAINLISDDGIYLESKQHELRHHLFSSASNIVGKSIFAVLPPEIADRKFRAIKTAIATGQAQCYEQVFEMDGNLYCEEVRIVKIDNHSVLCLARDVKERREAEMALRKSEERFQKIMATVPGAIQIFVQHVDGSSAFEYVSPGFENINEITVETVCQNPNLVFEQVHRDDIDGLLYKVAESSRTLKTLLHECRIITTSGKTKWLQFNSQPERRSNGDIYWYGVVFDVTSQKETEVDLAKAKELAEAANRAKSDFLANMSHEIRTPMNGVLGMAQLLATTPLREDQRNFVQVILDSGDILMMIINDILDFSKLESGKLQLEQKPFNIFNTVNSVCNLLNKQAADKGVKLQYHINEANNDANNNYFIGDQGRLKQILINLIGNAIKFTEHGDVTIAYKCKPLQQEGQGIYEFEFTIADTGIGIPRDRIGSLFKPFTQADASISRQYGGTGLGLAICKRFVEMMGGHTWVESHGNIGGNPPPNWLPNYATGDRHGAKFYFTVQLPLSQMPKVAIAKPPSDLSEVNAKDLPLRILLVEDNIFNQKIVQIMLERMGYEIAIANNGEECLALLFGQGDPPPTLSYDLVLMDVQMPVMDGLTATKLIRQRSGSASCPWIVALTADVMPEDYESCLKAGMNDYISKPIDIKALKRSLQHFVLTYRKG
ncbi:response regulator [Pseudanabaena sp. FACHB-1277]|uniref:Circadian input-output histidine kinase CikA n=1 Tax=Pseudanabaena cinerea FACHB-1277 TaxID=2949581 RepID=A0A926Z6W3_9CYAN|nr:response regulator [Pseudanabaena cinerea]MBD2151233.1 response regulator [Pseudanabaena cinerea FACHB-1277]